MSFARGDLARRAALADNLAVPEPWSSNDDPRVFAAIRDLRNEFRQLGITDADGKGRLPDFLLDYENLPPIKPTTLDRAHIRNSSATRWDQNGNLVEDSSDTLRLQRDPKTQEVEGLLYEPKRTQLFSDATSFDPGSTDWSGRNVTVSDSAGNAKGQPYASITENNGTNNPHDIIQFISMGNDEPLSLSAVVKANGRNFLALQISDNGNGKSSAFFNLSTGTLGSDISDPDLTQISHEIEDLGGGWYRCKISALPDGGSQFNTIRIFLADGDGSVEYDGDGTSGIFVMHTQAEVSREVTTPILTGNATRGADEVDHRFSFPDKTTGVAASIFDAAGGKQHGAGFTLFGTTSGSQNEDHGVLMDEFGINARRTDGWKTTARNSNDDDLADKSPLNETIDRFQMKLDYAVSSGRAPVRIIRQIAIHTRPHTQAQKDTLRDQYLTQP